MALEIGRAIRNGVDKLLSPAGAQLYVAFLAFQLAFVVAVNTVTVAAFADAGVPMQDSVALSLPVGAGIAGALGLLAWLFGLALNVVLARVVVSDRSGTVPREFYTRRMLPAVGSLLLAGIATGILVSIGFVFLFVPGVFLAVSFAFVNFYVAVEDDGPIAAMKHSWNLASGNRLRIFLLILLLAVVLIAASFVSTPLTIVSPIAGSVVSILVTTAGSILSVAVLGDAYVQLQNEPEAVDADDLAQ